MIPFDELVRPASEVPAEERTNYMWIASADLLSAWLDLHNSYKVKDHAWHRLQRLNLLNPLLSSEE